MVNSVSWTVCVRLELIESKHVPFSDQGQKVEKLAFALIVWLIFFLNQS